MSGYFMHPTRRSYSKSFKDQVIQECAQPGASIASIALSHGLNFNLVHKWIRLQTQNSTVLQPVEAVYLARFYCEHQQPRCFDLPPQNLNNIKAALTRACRPRR
nr:transposase [Pseudomonas syringae]